MQLRDILFGADHEIEPSRLDVFDCTPAYRQEFEGDPWCFELDVTQDVCEQDRRCVVRRRDGEMMGRRLWIEMRFGSNCAPREPQDLAHLVDQFLAQRSEHQSSPDS